MDRDLLAHLPVVVTVARQKGFAAAASVLNMSASAVSHAVKAVEDRLGEPLFARTTRSVSLTEAGATLIATLESALDDIGSAVESLTAARGSVTGTLRINAPHSAFAMGLTRVSRAWRGTTRDSSSKFTPTRPSSTSWRRATTPASAWARPCSRTWSPCASRRRST